MTAVIERLASPEGRVPGSEGERRAAGVVADELRALGREAEVEQIRIRPAYALVHALHAALGVAGSVIAVDSPPAGLAILLLVSLSLYGDLTGRFHLLRRITPRRSSQNVTSRGGQPDAPARLVLVAHHDAARSGLLFARRRRPAPRVGRWLARLGGPLDVPFWTLIAILMITLLRLVTGTTGDDSTLLTAIQFVPTVLLIAWAVLLVDVALSDAVPGASSNASGVAAALEVARRLGEQAPERLDVWVVSPGAKEGLMLGMREWLRSHRDELDPRRTFFLNLDTVGAGNPRHLRAEGFVVVEQHDARLVRLAASAAASIGADPAPHVWRRGTDATVATMRGFSAMTICCTDEHGRPPRLNRPTDTADQVEPRAVRGATDLAEAVARAIDRELVPSIAPSLVPAPAST